MTGRAYMGEVLNQVWLKSWEVLNQSLKKLFWDACKLPQAHKKVYDENERNKVERKRNDRHLKYF